MAKDINKVKDQVHVLNLPKKEKFLGLRVPWLVRYSFALVAVGIGALLRLAITTLAGSGLPTYITFYPAVMVAALLGGIAPGLVATVASVIIVDIWVVPGYGFFVYDRPVDLVGQLLFILMGIFMSYIAGVYRKTQDTLQEQVAKRTASLDKSNEQLKEEIEERKKYEDALRGSEQRLKFHFENSPLAVVEWNSKFIVTQWSKEAERMFGWKKEETIGKRIDSLNMIYEDDILIVNRTMEKLTSGEKQMVVSSNRNVTKSGQVIECTWYNSVLLDQKGEMASVMSLVQDITKRKQAEKEKERLLIEIGNRAAELDATISSVAVGMIVYDTSGKSIRMNDTAKELLPKELFFNKTIEERTIALRWETEDGRLFPPEEIPVKRALHGETVQNVILALPLDGHKLWISASAAPIRTTGSKMLGVIASFVDITKQKQAEESLKKLNRTLKALSDSSQAMMHTSDEIDYLNYICNIVVNDCGYSMVWIGFAENDKNKTVRPVAQAGFEEGYLKKLNITWDDSERGRGPTGTAIRTGKVSICNDMLSDPNFEPWRKEAIKRGYASSIVLPLMAGNKAIGALNIYSKEISPFSKDEINLLSELAYDVSLGIASIRLRIINERSEEILRQTKNYLENLINHANAPIIVWSPALVITRFNQAFEKLTGLKSTDVLGKKLEILFPKESKEESLKKIRRTSEGEYWESIEIPILRKNGDVKIVLWNSANILGSDGKTVISTIAQGQDITRRKQAEEALRESEEKERAHAEELSSVLDAVPAAVWIASDPKGYKITGNRLSNEWLHLSEGANASKSAPKGERPETFRMFKDGLEISPEQMPVQLSAAGKKIHNYEFTFVYPDNSVREVLGNATPLFDKNGKPRGSVSAFIDITKRKHAEEELQKLVKEKETLLKEIHHRVKNNMQMISSLIRMQSRRIDNKYVREVLDDGQNRIKSMALVHEILYKSDSLSNLDVNEYLKRIIADLQSSYKRPDRDVKIDLQADKIYLGIDLAIPCGLIVNELVSNSLKYAFNKRKQGKISVFLKDQKGTVELTVKDNGIGLPADFDIDKLQSLGLQLVDTLTKQIDGKLEIKSKKGTEFKIDFPLNKNG